MKLKVEIFRDSFVKEGHPPVPVKVLGPWSAGHHHRKHNGHDRWYYDAEFDGEKRILSVGSVAHAVIEENLPLGNNEFLLEKIAGQNVCRTVDSDPDSIDIPIILPGGNTKQSNQLFFAIREIGMLDEKGKKILAVNYSGKIDGKPDRPLATVVWPLLNEILKYSRYSNDEAAVNDLEQFKRFVNCLKCE